MPKVVDHDARRAEIVDAYLAIVAEDGFPAANGKRVCDRLGMSVGSLWHYFRTFDEVIEAAAISVFERDTARLAVPERSGLDAVCHAAEALLPLDDRTRTEAEVIVTFWGQIPARNALRSPAAAATAFSAPIHALLEQALERGELRGDTPTALLAESVNQLLDGAQVAQVLEPRIAPARHRARIACLIAPWLSDAEGAGSERIARWLADADSGSD